MTRRFAVATALSTALAAQLAGACSAPKSPPPAAPPPEPADFPPAPIETTSSSPEEGARALEPDSSVTRDAGTGIADMDASAVAADAGPSASQSPGGSAMACTTDADCVPAECCHPKTCVAKSMAPNCAGTMCTRECRGGTMDCGGGCFCQQGRCNARLGP